jgi:hypothetical protein
MNRRVRNRTPGGVGGGRRKAASYPIRSSGTTFPTRRRVGLALTPLCVGQVTFSQDLAPLRRGFFVCGSLTASLTWPELQR